MLRFSGSFNYFQSEDEAASVNFYPFMLLAISKWQKLHLFIIISMFSEMYAILILHLVIWTFWRNLFESQFTVV